MYSKKELSHTVKSGKYDYEVFGPNGFYRHFKGENKPELEISLNNNSSKNEVELLLKTLSKKTYQFLWMISIIKIKKISLRQSEEKITFNLEKMKSWYDIKIKLENTIWHFAGRLETGKPTVSDPHWV